MGSTAKNDGHELNEAGRGGGIPADYRAERELREALRELALRRWREAVASFAKGSAPPRSDLAAIRRSLPVLNRVADESLQVVERFALGAAAEATADNGAALGTVADMPGEAFDLQLGLILDSVATRAPSEHPRPANAPSPRPQSFQGELWQVLHKVRESAELSYAREIDLVELDRRILFLLRRLGPLVPANLSTSIGVDKAQVSRSVKRLLELKMIERKQIRSPVTLTRRGETLADRLLRLAELRNRELCFDITDGELQDFFGTIEVLLDRAMQLYDQEREHDDSKPEFTPSIYVEERKKGEQLVIDRSRIVSPLMTLSAYFSRSGALTFKRLTHLSNFEAWVLNEISLDPPTDWTTLVKALQRDHSQAGRTVNILIEKGLVVRDGKPGRRHGRFSPTDEGRRLFDIINDAALKRSSYLMAPLEPARLSGFLATFDKVRRNSEAQLLRERALEEFDNR